MVVPSLQGLYKGSLLPSPVYKFSRQDPIMQFSSLDYASAKSTHGTGKKKHTKPVAKEPVYTKRDLPAVTPTTLYWYQPVGEKHNKTIYEAHKLANQEDCNQISECYWGRWNKTATFHPKAIVTYPYNMTGKDSKKLGLFHCMLENPEGFKHKREEEDDGGTWPIFHQCSPYARTSLEKGEDGKEKNVTRIVPNCATPTVNK
ncbi:hypothetical protein BCR37DRAFT_265172 [Protomyces lactucae-debilis]|uniref:Uncharacterized protein n=1 Tax=Protomyces lactucae-debilis TaxID=2754530 RepID=A0A1Y2FK72_PROLT|nr:uncharacterized protein BCR37DRAFT_265172 [Protomyces lactucae-debilis]ORY84358.1 hypothetical protein BCR37DRAFT_265172 [Protomyces lactucae-debilis]